MAANVRKRKQKLSCLLLALLTFISSSQGYQNVERDTYIQSSNCQQEVNCRRPNCVCSSNLPPLGMASRDIPQLVYFTFDDAVTDFTARSFHTLFPPERTNPNGCPIPMTLFISDKSTNYNLVRSFYDQGMELAVHSVNHGHIKTTDAMLYESVQQRRNIATKSGVPIEAIRGWRSPFLLPYGDKHFEILKDNGFLYDSTLTIGRSGLKGETYWPLTMDYGWPYSCMVVPCPKGNYNGFWEIPIVSVTDYLKAYPCQYIDGCVQPPPDSESAFQYLWQNFQSYYRHSRAPFGINMHAAWFAWPERLAGMNRFIQELVKMEDVYIVTIQQLIAYMKNPVNLNKARYYKPWQCKKNARSVSSQGSNSRPNSRPTTRKRANYPTTTTRRATPRTTTRRATTRRQTRRTTKRPTTTPTTKRTTRFTTPPPPRRTTPRSTTTRRLPLPTTVDRWWRYQQTTPWWHVINNPQTAMPWWHATLAPVKITSHPWWESVRRRDYVIQRPTTQWPVRWTPRRTVPSRWTTTRRITPRRRTTTKSWRYTRQTTRTTARSIARYPDLGRSNDSPTIPAPSESPSLTARTQLRTTTHTTTTTRRTTPRTTTRRATTRRQTRRTTRRPTTTPTTKRTTRRWTPRSTSRRPRTTKRYTILEFAMTTVNLGETKKISYEAAADGYWTPTTTASTRFRTTVLLSGSCQQGLNCFLPTCFCDGIQVPKRISIEQTPQMVYFTFEGPISSTIYMEFVRLFSRRKRNPNGCAIKATFFVPAGSTDPQYTQALYERGNEISLLVHSGDPIRQRDLLAVRTKTSKYDIKGWRGENLEPLPESAYTSMSNYGFEYDSTMMSTRMKGGEHQRWPMTLDFGWQSQCNIQPCPAGRLPGIWEVPVVASYDAKGRYPCTYADGCHLQTQSTNETYNLLWENFQTYYFTNRAPFAVNLRQTWFHSFYRYHLDAVDQFISKLLTMENVYIVTVSGMIDWMKDPLPLNELRNFQSWQCF